MDRRLCITLLLPFALLACGFTWGLGKSDPCGEASKSVAGLTPESPAAQLQTVAKSVSKSCADGAAADYLRGISLEAEKKGEHRQWQDQHRADDDQSPFHARTMAPSGRICHRQMDPNDAGFSRSALGANRALALRRPAGKLPRFDS